MSRNEYTIIRNSNEFIKYKNAKVSKAYEHGVYDIKFSTGEIQLHVENVSIYKFNSGDYVSVLVSFNGNEKKWKIIGKGRKINEFNLIPTITV